MRTFTAGGAWDVYMRKSSSLPATAQTPLPARCLSAPACACRVSLWRVLFWQPLHASAGLYLVNLLALAAALWASLHVHSLWQLLRWVGGWLAVVLWMHALHRARARQPVCGGWLELRPAAWASPAKPGALPVSG